MACDMGSLQRETEIGEREDAEVISPGEMTVERISSAARRFIVSAVARGPESHAGFFAFFRRKSPVLFTTGTPCNALGIIRVSGTGDVIHSPAVRQGVNSCSAHRRPSK